MAGSIRQYERPVTGRRPKVVALAVALVLCVALPICVASWLGTRPYEAPPEEPAAVEGVPAPPDEVSFGYGGAGTEGGFTAGLASKWVRAEDGSLPIWFANPAENEVSLMIRICRSSDGKPIFESGLLRPGTYVERLEPEERLDAEPIEVEAAIYSFDEDYLSLGTLRLPGTVS